MSSHSAHLTRVQRVVLDNLQARPRRDGAAILQRAYLISQLKQLWNQVPPGDLDGHDS